MTLKLESRTGKTMFKKNFLGFLGFFRFFSFFRFHFQCTNTYWTGHKISTHDEEHPMQYAQFTLCPSIFCKIYNRTHKSRFKYEI